MDKREIPEAIKKKIEKRAKGNSMLPKRHRVEDIEFGYNLAQHLLSECETSRENLIIDLAKSQSEIESLKTELEGKIKRDERSIIITNTLAEKLAKKGDITLLR